MLHPCRPAEETSDIHRREQTLDEREAWGEHAILFPLVEHFFFFFFLLFLITSSLKVVVVVDLVVASSHQE